MLELYKSNHLSYVLLILCCFVLNQVQSQALTKKDTTYSIEEIKVEGTLNSTKWVETPISTAIITQQKFKNQPSFSLLPTLNAISGVRMEERSQGSIRLSIRGSVLRSPFGVRNIKMYLDDFPLTDAGGNTYLNLVDAIAIKKIELLKGPQGSLYGTNTGGAVLINSMSKLNDSLQGKASFQVGSYGLMHQQATFEMAKRNNQIAINQSWQQSQGYREQSAMDRKFIQIVDEFQYHKRLKLKALAFYSDLRYQTPGGLTLAQFNQNPQAARPTTATNKGAIDQNAFVENNTLFLGIAHESKINDRIKHKIALFGSETNFKNSAIANFETRKENTYGFRTYLEVTQKQSEKPLHWKWHTGVEWQNTTSSITNFGNKLGIKDTFQSSNSISAKQYFIFSQYSMQFKHLTIETGISYNRYIIDYKYLTYKGLETNSQLNYPNNWLPRIAASYGISENLYIRASASKGISSPTVAEIAPSGVQVNQGLRSEYGTNYETGIRFHHELINIDVSAFRFDLTNAIVRRVNDNGTEFYANAGGTSQLGIESQINLKLLRKSSKNLIFRQIELSNSATFYHFKFKNYKNASNDYSGKNLTGVPNSVIVTGLNAVFKNNIFIYIQHNFTSAIPLNDANTEFASHYNLVQLKTGWQISIKKSVKLELWAGIDNILNQKYSLGNDINAFGKRYYNPAPLRNYYAGLSIGF